MSNLIVKSLPFKGNHRSLNIKTKTQVVTGVSCIYTITFTKVSTSPTLIYDAADIGSVSDDNCVGGFTNTVDLKISLSKGLVVAPPADAVVNVWYA